MVSKCANPACLVPFRYLHEGRIFTVQADTERHGSGTGAIVERYWLCSKCSESMTLVLQNGRITLRELADVPEARLKARAATRSDRWVA